MRELPSREHGEVGSRPPRVLGHVGVRVLPDLLGGHRPVGASAARGGRLADGALAGTRRLPQVAPGAARASSTDPGQHRRRRAWAVTALASLFTSASYLAVSSANTDLAHILAGPFVALIGCLYFIHLWLVHDRRDPFSRA